MINKINYVEGGNFFSEGGGAIEEIFTEIPKEEYERLINIENYRFELSKYLGQTLPEYILSGYGFYGADLAQKDGCYYLVKKIGSTCD